MDRLQVGVIGGGSIARHRHVPEYAANPRARFRAITDRVRERAEKLAAPYGATVYADYRELLADPDIAAVSVCLPNALHAEVTIAALRAGKHVLCEKPMATSAAEAEAMIEAAKAADKLLMIGHNQRFMPAHVKAKHILHSGRLGAVLSFRTTFSHAGPEGWAVDGNGTWFFRVEDAFVGALGDLGIHKADLIRWLFEEEVVSVSALLGTLEKRATVEDNAVCLLKLQSGAMGTLTASWTLKGGEDNSTHLYCEHGAMHIAADPEYPVIVNYEDGTTDKVKAGPVSTNEAQTASGVIDEFVDAVWGRRESAVPGEEGKASLQVILAALESARSGRTMNL